MTHAQQKALLKKHIKAFLKHQRKATLALREITEIGLLENEGNPWVSPISGEASLQSYSNNAFQSGEVEDTINDAQIALNNSMIII